MESRTPLLVLLVGAALLAALVYAFLPDGNSVDSSWVEIPVQEQSDENRTLAPEQPGDSAAPDPVSETKVERSEIETTLTPKPSATFLVQVLTPRGEPCSDAFVAATRDQGQPRWTSLLYGRYADDAVATDREGLAQVPTLITDDQPVLVAVRSSHGTALASRPRQELSADQAWVLTLEPSSSVAVRTLDRAGNPRAGVTVGWYRNSEEQQHAMAKAQSNAEGMVRFDGLERMLGQPSVLGTAIAVPGVFVDRPMRTLQEAELAGGVIDLVVPETGAIQVQMRTEDDSPLPMDLEAKLVHTLGPEHSFSEFFRWRETHGDLRDAQADGRARFPTVEIGQRFQLGVTRAFFAEPEVFELMGPLVAGETVEHEVVLSPDPNASHSVLILLPSGEPLPDTAMRIDVSVSGDRASSHIGGGESTDAEGWLRFDLPTTPTPEEWTLRLNPEGEFQSMRWYGEGKFGSEGHDMPTEVTLREIPLIASGTVVHADGSTPSAFLSYGLGVRKPGSGAYQSHDQFSNLADGVGMFEIRADDLPDGIPVISARVGDTTVWTDVEVALGQRDVRIEIPSSGWFVVDAGENPHALFEQLEVVLALPEVDLKQRTQRDPFSSESVPRGNAIAKNALTHVKRSGRTAAVPARAGSLQLAVKDDFGRILFQQFVELASDTTRDEPQVFTLPPLSLQTYRLRVRTAAGDALEYVSVEHPHPSGGSAWLNVRNGLSEFVSNQLPPTCTLKSNGYEDQKVDWTRAEESVVLTPDHSADEGR